jgi:hypothetical protein
VLELIVFLYKCFLIKLCLKCHFFRFSGSDRVEEPKFEEDTMSSGIVFNYEMCSVDGAAAEEKISLSERRRVSRMNGVIVKGTKIIIKISASALV